MHPRKKKELLSKLREVVESAIEEEPTFEDFQPHMFYSSEAGFFALSGDGLGYYRELLSQLTDHRDWVEKFSESYIEKQLKEIIARSLSEEADTASLFEDLIAELSEYQKEQTVYIPVLGLKLDSPLEIGNVEFFEAAGQVLDDIKKTVGEIVRSTTTYQEGHTGIAERAVSHVDERMQGKICAKFAVVAEPERARERAKDEVQRALDLVRYAAARISPANRDVFIGIEGEILSGGRFWLTISDDHVHQHFSRTGSLVPFIVDEEVRARFSLLQIDVLSEVLKKPSLSGFEKRVLQSIHWYSRAQLPTSIESRFISLIVALETLLSRSGQSYSSALGEGVAFILHDEFSPRKEICKAIKDYYGKRSAIAHAGSKPILKSELDELSEIVGGVLLEVLRRFEEFDSIGDLYEFIDRRKFG